jgi:mono/diheme cytochrome c family protein
MFMASPRCGRAGFPRFPIIVLVFVAICGLRISAYAQSSTEGEAQFSSKCYSCHNIGSGDKTGPDLKGVTSRRTKDWLHGYILSPATMKDKGDPVAADLFRKFPATVMPDQTLTPEQIDSILALITDLTNKNQPFIPPGAKLSRAIMPGDVDGGWQLFMGRARLQNGGAACISCHSIKDVGVLGGGTLGPDLTAANIKYRDPELISILQNPNFPTMATVFATHGLTNEEIVKLFALFQDSKLRNPMPPAQAGVVQLDPKFFVVGVAAMLLVLMLLHLAWRNRLHGVREELVERALSKQ